MAKTATPKTSRKTVAAAAAAAAAPSPTPHDGAMLVAVPQPSGATVIIPSTAVSAPAPAPAPTAPVLTFDYSTSGASLARADAHRARLVEELGKHLKTECSMLPAWEAARALFIEGAKRTGYLAPEKLWERTIKYGQEFGLIPDKPKAMSESATKKAAQRESKAAKIEELATRHSADELLKASAEASVAGDANRALDFLTAAKRAREAADKAAREAAASEIEALTKCIREAVRRLEKAGDVANLRILATYARDMSPEPAPATV